MEENLDVDMLWKLTHSTPWYISQLAKVEEVTTVSIDAIQVNVIEDQDDEWMSDLVMFFTTREASIEKWEESIKGAAESTKIRNEEREVIQEII